jgi:hypothetical protein
MNEKQYLMVSGFVISKNLSDRVNETEDLWAQRKPTEFSVDLLNPEEKKK